VVSDDFGCPPGWDESLAALFADRYDIAVLVDDALDARIMTLPILGRDLFNRLGFVYHPSYQGLFADDDLTETARALGVLVDARHLVFPHRHFTTGQASIDGTYLRHNHRRGWWSGWRTFEKRKLEGFDVSTSRPRRTLAAARVDLYVGLRVLGSIIRQRWLKRLPASWVEPERRIRDRVIRAMSRLFNVVAPA